MEITRIVDIVGIAAFSVAGTFAALEKRLDVFGTFVIAFVTALGGGTVRDVLIGKVPVSWMYDLTLMLVVAISTAITMMFTSSIQNFRKILLLFDSIGLGFFTVVGIQKGLALDLHPVICVALGTITACFGGIIRDICLNNIPLIFQKEIYATACIFGGVVYFIMLSFGPSRILLEGVSVASVVVLRLLALRYNWQLPATRKMRFDDESNLS